jgi:4Fe-4S ferredoxin
MSKPKECDEPKATVLPIIDQSRCEGKEDCVRVCPYDVFEVRTLSRAERDALPFISRLKVRFHGNRQAFVVRAEACHACGLCVKACPERAIKLRSATAPT